MDYGTPDHRDYIKKFAKDDLKGFVDNFCYRADVLFDILQRSIHKSSFNINGEYTVVTIQRKVYTGGTSKPSPTRTDIKKYDERKGQCKNLKEN